MIWLATAWALDVGSVVRSSGVSEEDVARVFSGNMAALSSCYEMVSVKHPDLSGSVLLSVTLNSTGRVAAIAPPVASTQDPVFEGCLVGAVWQWQFPVPQGIGGFTYRIEAESVKAGYWLSHPPVGEPEPVVVTSGVYRAGGGEVRLSGAPSVLGALEISKVEDGINDVLPGLLGCYQRELALNSTLSGKVSIKFVIAKNGSVSSASVRASSLSNPLVESCLIEQLYQQPFARPTGNGVVVVAAMIELQPVSMPLVVAEPVPVAVVPVPVAPPPAPTPVPVAVVPVPVAPPPAPTPVPVAPPPAPTPTSVPVAPPAPTPTPVPVAPPAPTSAVVPGVFSKTALDSVMREHIPALRQCMARAPESEPIGKISVSFVVSPYGAVSSATVTLGNPTLGAIELCMEDELMTMRFPAPADGNSVTVKYPM